MDKVEGRLEVDADDSVPLCFGHAHHQSVLRDTGIVDQDVNAAEVSVYLLYHFFGLRKVSSVAGVGDTLYALSFDFSLCGFTIFVDNEVGECDVGTFFSELQGDSLANAAGGTCNQCGFTR